MAQEAKRGCGYREVGGIYLVADGLWASCDRLPLQVDSCPTCSEGIHFPRAPREINPLKLFGEHKDCTERLGSTDPLLHSIFSVYPRSCHVCRPTEDVAYLLGVGEKYYTPQSFITESQTLGLSKRIPAMPKKLEIGKTWVYLVHRQALVTSDTVAQMAIFAAFVPQRVEMPIWESDLTPEKREELEKRGITPVPFKDGDPDHAPRRKR